MSYKIHMCMDTDSTCKSPQSNDDCYEHIPSKNYLYTMTMATAEEAADKLLCHLIRNHTKFKYLIWIVT